jgi:hypothetical protein
LGRHTRIYDGGSVQVCLSSPLLFSSLSRTISSG